ncbi:PhzF family phenazine biosynthesis protein [Haloarchaeobius salinus]|uniref:PhzF family phenazine biosynthesis protein n=1 Tax=Haloarchaeobius salinus TaxID=1198298 RepID=UPI00210B7D93
MSHEFHLCDVFATERYAGNQLAVVTDAGDLSTDEMQAVANEMNYSESTFVTGRDDDGWDVRIFTPNSEIPFAGHPTLGTAAVIREHLAAAEPDPITLHLGVGDVPVRVEGDDEDPLYWMTQRPPEFGRTFDRGTAAAALGLSVDDVRDDLPVQWVSTGLPTVVVPLRDRNALERAEVDPDGYAALTGDHDGKNVLAFCPEPRDSAHDYADRVFAPFYGVTEDPATGSSNGCLAGYLVRHRDAPLDVVVEQGYEMGRPSLLHLVAGERDGSDGDGEIEVQVGGRVVPVARGELY